MLTISPIILCGGSGTRLWPASRQDFPKQFIKLFGARSTFQDTVLRVSDPDIFAPPIIVTNADYRFLIQEQLTEIGAQATILLEPQKRDSGPAILAGAIHARTADPDSVALALAADHVIRDVDSFVTSCKDALEAAQAGYLVTFGLTPDRAATEYGYISPGKTVAGPALNVERFVEKPDAETAARYVDEGYLWNTGNFMFRVDALIDQYRLFDPECVEMVNQSISAAAHDLGFVVLDDHFFGKANSNSIDYAVMEKTSSSAVLPVGYDWSDVGSWRAVWQLFDKDKDGNSSQGQAIFDNSKNCNVVTEKAVVALDGVDDLTVIATQDAILVSRQSDPNALRRLVSQLKETSPQVTNGHLQVHRPWGSYRSLDLGDRHQVKRIIVKPGSRLSLQKHHHRSEHWIVVRGAALVTVNEIEKIVHENESIYIPIGSVHRLENPGKILLELIEVQTGSYLGEDDIVRIEDDYRRVEIPAEMKVAAE